MRLIAYDLCCCAGGAAMGLYRAGFRVIGVDIEPQPNYPFEFIQGDAMEQPLDGAAFAWASPPCQKYSPLNAYNKKEYPDLVAPMRAKLLAAGIPWAMENVVQAPLIHPTMLCGCMFGLRVYRHRNFETSFPLHAPTHPKHTAICARNGYLPKPGQFMTISGGKHSEAWRRAAAETLGVPWTKTIREVCEAIPPAYSEFIGRAALRHINANRGLVA